VHTSQVTRHPPRVSSARSLATSAQVTSHKGCSPWMWRTQESQSPIPEKSDPENTSADPMRSHTLVTSHKSLVAGSRVTSHRSVVTSHRTPGCSSRNKRRLIQCTRVKPPNHHCNPNPNPNPQTRRLPLTLTLRRSPENKGILCGRRKPGPCPSPLTLNRDPRPWSSSPGPNKPPPPCFVPLKKLFLPLHPTPRATEVS